MGGRHVGVRGLQGDGELLTQRREDAKKRANHRGARRGLTTRVSDGHRPRA